MLSVWVGCLLALCQRRRRSPKQSRQCSAPAPQHCGFAWVHYPWALPRSCQTTSKAKAGSGCHRALLRHRRAPVMSPLRTETPSLPNHLLHPCSSGTTRFQPSQCTLTGANSLYVFSPGQAQQLYLCVCGISGFRGAALLHPFPSTDLEVLDRQPWKHPGTGRT